MDVIGNNISNVNTYGYKANRATFSDVFYSTRKAASAASGNAGGTNPSQIGYGAKVSTVDVNYTRAGAATTSIPLDVYINGDGFVAVKTADGKAMFTRAGVLGFDAEGNLVDRNGNMVLGMPMQTVTLPSGATESRPKLDQSGKAAITDLVTIRLDPAVEYTGIEISTKGEVTALKPGASIFTPGTNTGWMSQIPQAGNSQATKDSALKDGTNLFGEVRVTVTRTGGQNQITAVYAFDKSNTLVNLGTGFPTTGDLTLGADATALQDYLSKLSGLSSDGDTRDITIGRVEPGTSTPEVLGQLAVVTFQNTSGLSQAGEDYYEETVNSGEAQAYTPGMSGTGSIMAGMLEMSNVDLSREFTEMIITERGFQANSRMITVSDEMLQELINMKR
jgi:flagellar hook protein FlgE